MMSSISNFGRTTLAAGSGAIVDFLNGEWALFFILTSVMVIPGLCLLLWVGKLLKTYTGSDENYSPL
jgi:PAT family beta-lactamase induction signal transducer AmpG